MTYMDDVHSDWETKAKEATHTLQFWLGTIAPVNAYLTHHLTGMLSTMAETMNWRQVFDKDLGVPLIVMENQNDTDTTRN